MAETEMIGGVNFTGSFTSPTDNFKINALAELVVKKILQDRHIVSLFPQKPIALTDVTFEVKEDRITLLPFSDPLSNGTDVRRALRDTRTFQLPAFNEISSVLYNALQNVRQEGTTEPKLPEVLVMELLERGIENIMTSVEFLCSQALYQQALVDPSSTNPSASTVIYDYTSNTATGFGILGGATRPAQTSRHGYIRWH